MTDTPKGADPKPRPQRQRVWRPNFQAGPKVWDPAKIGVVRGYPKTQEAWEKRKERQAAHAARLNAEGKLGRRGVPDGWAGRKEEAAVARVEAQREASMMVAEMRRQDPSGGDPRAWEMLELAMSLARDRSLSAANRAAAARLFLTFTKTPFTVRHVLTVDPTDFLQGLAEMNDPEALPPP